MRSLMLGLVIAWQVLLPSLAFAQAPPSVGEPDPAVVETRVYDLRDLIMKINNYPFTGEFGAPAGKDVIIYGSSGKPIAGGPTGDRTRATTTPNADTLKTLITDTIEPDSWRDAGGTVGSISELAGLLIITQTPKAHERIANLLGQVREDHLRTVRVQADWLTLKPEDAAMLLVEPKAGKAVSTKSNPRLVDPAVLQKLAALCPHWRVELNCFSGQTVSIASGRTRTAIVDQEPVVAQNAAALGPQVKQVRDGAVLEITPTLETTLDTVVVDVHSQVANWTDAGPAPVAPTQVQVNPKDGAHLGGDSAANIDRLNLVTQDLRTAARVPVGPPVLVGGMTLEPAMGQSGAQLYLILQVTTAEAPTITAK